MASRSALTEEGRTRIRNFSGRLTSYFVVWVLVAICVVIICGWLRTRFGYLPLQRLYLSQYLKASINTLIRPKHASRYSLLLRVVPGNRNRPDMIVRCTDDEVITVRDQNGHVRFDPRLGPFFRLRDGIPHKYFYWETVTQTDSRMYGWLRDDIYNGRSLLALYTICFLPFPVIVIAGMILSIKIDVRINREYEEGRLLRGVRLLSYKEYAAETRQTNGLGVPAFGSNRRLRWKVD